MHNSLETAPSTKLPTLAENPSEIYSGKDSQVVTVQGTYNSQDGEYPGIINSRARRPRYDEPNISFNRKSKGIILTQKNLTKLGV